MAILQISHSLRQQRATLWRVLRQPAYLTLALSVSMILLVLLSTAQHYTLVRSVLGSSLTLSDKLVFLWGIVRTLGATSTVWSGLATGVVVLLFGVQLALLVFYIRHRQVSNRIVTRRAGVASVAGTVAALFGIGCAACGTVIVTGLLSAVSLGGLLVWLPFGGIEFIVLGGIGLCYSIVYLLKHIDDPRVCTPE